jgi:hypothetical protein
MNMQSDFDDLIDAIAQRMTEGPTPQVRARVAARLDRSAPRTWAWKAALAMAAAVVAVMFFVVVPKFQGSVVPRAERQSAIRPMNPGTPEPRNRGTSEPVTRVASRSEPHVPSPRPQSADEAAWEARAVRPLPAIDPLSIENIQPAPLDVRPLTIAPLEIPALDDEDN